MARLRYNGLTATLGANLLTAGTTITFSAALTHAAGAVPTIAAGDYIPLAILDADNKPVEVVHLTAYTSGATTGTVTRAQEGTTAADHIESRGVVHGPTVADFTPSSSGGAVTFGDEDIRYGDIDVTIYGGQSDAAQRLDIPGHLATDEATHPSVLFFPEGWNGYRYWMAFTPYPGGNDATEDPCVSASQDGVTWETPVGLTNPLDDAPGGSRYNSDTELAISPDGTTLYLFWRQRDDAATGAEEIIYLRSTTDGVAWTAKQAILTANKATEILASPAVLYDGTQWVMWTVDVVPSPNVLRRRTAASPTGTWSAPTACTVTGLPAGRDLWHLHVLKLGSQYVALLNDCLLNNNGIGGRLYLMESTNQLAWTLNPTPVIDQALTGEHDSVYRGTLVPRFDRGRLEFEMWYGAWMSGATPVWGIYYRRLIKQAAAIGAGAGNVSGTGSPEGSVAADVGTIYTDTAATNGAIRWIKTSGTGTTGWKVEYADTGWRVIAAAGTISGRPSMSAAVRRVNSTVFVSIGETATTSNTTGLFSLWTVPAGWANGYANGWVTTMPADQGANPLASSLLYATPTSLGIRCGSTARHLGGFTYNTADQWPSSLPGTAA